MSTSVSTPVLTLPEKAQQVYTVVVTRLAGIVFLLALGSFFAASSVVLGQAASECSARISWLRLRFKLGAH